MVISQKYIRTPRPMMYNCKGEPQLSMFYERTDHMIKDIRQNAFSGKEKIRAALNADRTRVNEDEVVASHRKLSGERKPDRRYWCRLKFPL